MAGVEVLGRLCASSVDFSRVGGGGGVSELQSLEVAGFLSGLDRGPMLVALAKYMGDQSSRTWLHIDIRGHLLGHGLRWSGGRTDIFYRCDLMARLSMSEFIDDKCVRCHGTRFVKAKPCSCCGGTGFKRLKGREIARAIDVDESNYRRVWRDRYQLAVERLRGYEAEVNRAVSRYNWEALLKNN